MARDRYDDEDDDRGPPRGRGRDDDDDRGPPRGRGRDRDEDDDDDEPRGSPPPNYLVPAILVTLCCCLIGGVVSIVYAAQVNSKWQAGDYAGARAASANAKMWCWLSFGIGIVTNIIAVAFQVMAAQNAGGGGGFR
ncbi:MAG: CD225/dispanin family protein [Gemmataceae bacterium]|nr:CD225/dispanin family protein [Gemmataceae bacterium]